MLESTLNNTSKHHLAYWFKSEELIIQKIKSEDIKEIHDCCNELYMLKEDLIPFSFGGNKVRIAKMYFDDMEKRHCDVIIGYGNTRSNMCRAIANMAYGKGIYTYTGKAFAGMLDYIYGNNISEKKILFIHTGGTPLFFDWLKQSCVLQENKGGLDS